MKRVAVIGVRGYAAQYIRRLLHLSDRGVVRLAHVFLNGRQDRAEADKVFAGMAVHLSEDETAFFDALSTTDFCCIPVGIPYHAAFTVRAMEHGTDVLVEKPVAVGSQQLQLLKQAEAGNDGRIYVGYQHMYHPLNHACKQQLLEGKIGRITKASVTGIWPRDYTYYRRNDWAGKLNFRGLPVYDSPLNNAFAHDLNMLLYLLGDEPHESAIPECAEGHLYRNMDIESYDTAAVRVHLRKGVVVSICVSHASDDILDPVIDIQGEKGRLVWTHHYFRFETKEGNETSLTGTEEETRNRMFDNLFRYPDEKRPVCTLSLAAPQVKAIEMIHENCEIIDAQSGALNTRFSNSLIERIPAFLRGNTLA